MKKYFFYLMFMILIISGCQNENSVVDPNVPNSNIQQQPLDASSGFISLPLMKSNDSDLSDYALISGKVGGELEISGKLNISGSGSVEVQGKLDIPRNSFSGVKIISMTADKGSTSVTFGPSGSTFTKSLILDLEYEGLKLSKNDYSDIEFAYLGSDGKVYPAEYDRLAVNVKEGKLIVYGVKINHFSRFGFVR